MSGFGFSEAQEMFRESVRDFAKRELLPGARQRAKLDYVPMELVKKLGEQGFLGLNLPVEYGGQTADWVSVGIAAEEMAKIDTSLCSVPHQIIGCGLSLLKGNEELCKEWIPPLIKGEKLIANCITEPDFGSDASAMRSKAVRQGDIYLISGEKTAITFGLQSAVGIVFAKTDFSKGARGITAFLVPFNLPGISMSLLPHTGCKPYGAASIIFDNTPVPAKNRIGDEGTGFYSIMGELDFIRISVALEALGSAQTAISEAIEYSKTRHAFGKPIAKFEGVSFKIARAATEIEAARMLCYRTLWLKDQGQPYLKESAMCKWFSARVAFDAIHAALLIHGHLGYSEEFPMEQRLRDVLGLELTDGTEEILNLIISREIIGRDYLPYEKTR